MNVILYTNVVTDGTTSCYVKTRIGRPGVSTPGTVGIWIKRESAVSVLASSMPRLDLGSYNKVTHSKATEWKTLQVRRFCSP
jgi:hypothetical protein